MDKHEIIKRAFTIEYMINNYSDMASDIDLYILGVANVINKNDGWTALMFASRNCNIEVVELLIKAGVDINQESNSGLTALNVASTQDIKNLLNGAKQ